MMLKLAVLLLLLQGSVLGVEFVNILDNATAHSNLLVTASFYNDNTKYVTGSDDNTVKIWSLADNSLLQTLTYGDYILNVGLHPITNQLFVLVFDGSISIVDPDTYAETDLLTHPTGNANYIVFDEFDDLFIIVGYDGAGVSPAYHVYNLTTHAFIRSVTVSNIPAGDQIFVASLSINKKQLAMINAGDATSDYIVVVYSLLTDTEIFFQDTNTNTMKWVLYSPFVNGQFYTTSADDTLQKFKKDGSGNYVNVQQFDISAIGSPNCLNTYIGRKHLLVSAGNKIVYYYLNPSDPNYFEEVIQLPQLQDVFVFDLSPNNEYMIVGMRNGEMSMYELNWPQYPDEEEEQEGGLKQQALIGIIVGVIAFVLIIIILVVIWKCKCCRPPRIGNKDMKEDESNHNLNTKSHNNKKKVKKNKMQVIAVPPGKNKKLKDDSDNESEDLDYDQLMAHGTIIVIKDDDKKKDYIKKLKKQHKKQQKENEQKNGGESDASSDIDWDDFVQGNIIIIRDDDHRKKRKNKKTDKDSDLSSNPDYQMLMADGNVIIIADDEGKKKYVKQLKKQHERKKNENHSDASSDIDYDMLMAQENIIIIKDDDSKKKYIKNVKKDKELKEIKHDQVQANGTILVIKDDEKKKDLINNLKKKEQKNETPLDKQKYQKIRAADNIIVIRDHQKPDEDSDDESQPDYEQLMAEGTVIVIKDDDAIKKYNKFVQKQKKKTEKKKEKKENDSESSQQPDMDAFYVQGHVLVISDKNQKHMYTQFMKKNRKKDRNVSEESSKVDYDELMRDANAVAIKDDTNNMKKMQGKKEEEKDEHDSDIGGDQMMAQGNVIVIGGDGAGDKLFAEQNVIEIEQQ